jgi:electron transfer flavoprotein beta subunit
VIFGKKVWKWDFHTRNWHAHSNKELNINLHIIVCLKQIPDTAKVAIDPETGTLLRDGADSKTNVYDLCAFETALQIRNQTGGAVTAVSMGPPQAGKVVREALMLGADDGFLISDRAFAGSDVLATAYTLSQALLANGAFDLIITGKQTTDGDTAQVGPAIAEYLNLPHAAWVTEIGEIAEDSITVKQDLGDVLLDAKLTFPSLITVEKSATVPGLPSYLRKKQFADTPIKTLSLADFADRDKNKYGINGSPTQVEKIFPPAANTDKITLTGSPDELAAGIFGLLKQKKYIGQEGA